MEFFDAKKTISFKLVVFGPALGGKTTNLIQTFSGLKPDQKLSDKIVEIPTETDEILKYEFAPLSLGEINGWKLQFGVYTVPGQVHYEDSRKMILKNADGVIFVADSQRERYTENLTSVLEMERHIADLGYLLYDEIPVVMQFNKQDMPNALSPEELEKRLKRRASVPCFGASAIAGKGVVETFQKAIALMIEKGEKKLKIS